MNVSVALCFCSVIFAAGVAHAKKGGGQMKASGPVDTSDVVNPDPEAVDTETAEYGKYVEGDMKIENTNSEDRNAIGAGMFWSALWKGGKIPYVFAPSVDSGVQAKIMNAIADFKKYTCVDWQPRNGEKPYVKFESEPKGCYSSLGKRSGVEWQTLNLQNPGCVYKGIIIHEMLHAIGFAHEQSRNDRDDFVKVHYENIKKGYHSQFRKLTTRQENNMGFGYDFSSVMHYGPMGFSKNGKPAITTTNKAFQNKIGQRAGFSKQDIEEVNKLYPCSDEKTGGGGTTGSGSTTEIGGGATKPPVKPPVKPPTGSNCTDKHAKYCPDVGKKHDGYYCTNDEEFRQMCKKTCGLC